MKFVTSSEISARLFLLSLAVGSITTIVESSFRIPVKLDKKSSNLAFAIFLLFVFSTSIFISPSYADDSTIRLDKDEYYWTEEVEIFITAPNFNRNYLIIEKIGGGSDSDGNITIKTSHGMLDNYEFTETSPDSGIFFGKVILTGNANLDANGDKKRGDLSGITHDSHPVGQIASHGSDKIIVIFENEYEEIEAFSRISWMLGEFQDMPQQFDKLEPVLISIHDMDMNFKNTFQDMLYVMVSSEMTSYSKKIRLLETQDDSGIFEGYLKLSSEKSGVTTLQTTIPDTLYITYSDYTVPSALSELPFQDVIFTITLGELTPIPTPIPELTPTPDITPTSQIPEWIKNSAVWWGQGLISDDDFLKGIEFMVKNGFIVV